MISVSVSVTAICSIETPFHSVRLSILAISDVSFDDVCVPQDDSVTINAAARNKYGVLPSCEKHALSIGQDQWPVVNLTGDER